MKTRYLKGIRDFIFLLGTFSLSVGIFNGMNSGCFLITLLSFLIALFSGLFYAFVSRRIR